MTEIIAEPRYVVAGSGGILDFSLAVRQSVMYGNNSGVVFPGILSDTREDAHLPGRYPKRALIMLAARMGIAVTVGIFGTEACQ